MSEDLILKILWSIFCLVFTFPFIGSLREKRILFQQGYGIRANTDKRRFWLWILYHGSMDLIFWVLCVLAWIYG